MPQRQRMPHASWTTPTYLQIANHADAAPAKRLPQRVTLATDTLAALPHRAAASRQQSAQHCARPPLQQESAQQDGRQPECPYSVVRRACVRRAALQLAAAYGPLHRVQYGNETSWVGNILDAIWMFSAHRETRCSLAPCRIHPT